MPYIKQERRDIIYRDGCMYPDNMVTAGELNYAITELVHNYWNIPGNNYQRINDIIGALEGAKAEFQRRVVEDYEDEKIKENGDI